MFNVCYCGKQAGYGHAPDCPYPLFLGTDEDVARWENTRRALLDERAEFAASASAAVWWEEVTAEAERAAVAV
jgi:hypothetical protein